jgi:5'-3' exonuclease
MGIPFYFATLTRNHKGIIEPVKKTIVMEVDILAIDFNCFIHRYLKDESPIDSIIEALQYILENVCKPKQLIIAMDGLVPYGKIVQQRYRRMCIKDQGTFDRNQISPDTPYMREIECSVRTKFPYAIMSGTSMEGEGEHKLIHELSKIESIHRRTICIYGLDADLILIALQHHKLSNPQGMWLLRESTEFNDPAVKHAEFATLSIWKLLKELPMNITQYMILSMLCFGNDFMPSLGMFSLREDGYSRAIEIYEKAGNPDLTTIEGRKKFMKESAIQEFHVLEQRINIRKRPEEKAILGKNTSLLSKKYRLHVLDGVRDVCSVVEAYWKTFHWTLHYFQTNKPMNWFWVYPYSDAPLVSDIVEYSETTEIQEKSLNFTITDQLQFIMPSKSIRTSKRRVVYPNELYSETRNPWMKKYDWEMKPRISLPWNPEYELTKVIPI